MDDDFMLKALEDSIENNNGRGPAKDPTTGYEHLDGWEQHIDHNPLQPGGPIRPGPPNPYANNSAPDPFRYDNKNPFRPDPVLDAGGGPFQPDPTRPLDPHNTYWKDPFIKPTKPGRVTASGVRKPPKGHPYKTPTTKFCPKDDRVVSKDDCKNCEHYTKEDVIHDHCELKAKDADRLAGK